MTMLGKLSKLFQKASPSAPRVSLAAFGKHPGWDDHIDDLGLETARLVKVKSALYGQGVTANIDSGAWDQLSEQERLPRFAHEFLWRWAGECVVGLMWSSQDGKGRSKYPMVLCLQGVGLPVGWMCSTGLERLRALRDKCRAATTSATVRTAVEQARAELVEAVQTVPAGDNEPERHLIRRLRAEGPSEEEFIRVLYDIERRLGPMRAEANKPRTRAISIAPHALRLPKAGSSPVLESARAWAAVAMDVVGAGPILAAGLLCIDAAEVGHIDMIVGDPTPTELFGIRATTAREPLSTSIPFTIDDAFATQARTRLAAWG